MCVLDLVSQLCGKQTDLKQSIQQHLIVLLNTRRGSLQHLPDYGLPEFDARYGYSQAKAQFIQDLQHTIHIYEPRVELISVEETTSTRQDCVLCIKLLAKLTNETSLRLDALLLSGGDVLIEGQQL